MASHRRDQRTRVRLLVPGLLFIGMVVAVVSSLGAPLIPTVAATDRVSLNDAQWSLTMTFLVSALATPMMGRLGDGPHRRGAIIGSLAVVAAGSVLAALPLGFPFLLAGRGMQGVGLGLTPLGMAVARDALSGERSRSTVAMLSVTTVAGVGLGYPVTGLIAQHGGVGAAFWFGASVSVAALVVAVAVVPSSAHRPRQRLDVGGGVLLGGALAGLLLALSEGGTWGWTSALLMTVVAASLAALAGWTLLELRLERPLVDLRLLRNRAVLTADATTLLAGIGMYVLISLVTRFVQTPVSSGYGLGGSIVVSGLVLVPFSLGSVIASKLTPAVARRASAELVLPLSSVIVLLATAMFALVRSDLWDVVAVMGLAGLGVGAIFSVTPGFIVRSVPPGETGSATSFNQVIRYIGYAAGSTVSALVLQTRTAPGHALPAANGYTLAGVIGCAMWVVTAAVSLVLPRLGLRSGARTTWEPATDAALPRTGGRDGGHQAMRTRPEATADALSAVSPAGVRMPHTPSAPYRSSGAGEEIVQQREEFFGGSGGQLLQDAGPAAEDDADERRGEQFGA